ncbi:hypothetical protein Sjap_023876 [Stephania japonica]|uniref:Uncharacterized protein n=1 Tax=Stephania japonica TaxID=461633 RepID=A0AAP0EL12_9MAGN
MAGKTDSASIRVPYRNLNESEVELVAFEEQKHRIEEDPSFSNRTSDALDSSPPPPVSHPSSNCSLKTLVLSCMIAAGVQFGWALQLSLLTPYVQTLGVGHAFSSFIWLCGPITGLVIKDMVGATSSSAFVLPHSIQFWIVYMGLMAFSVSLLDTYLP